MLQRKASAVAWSLFLAVVLVVPACFADQAKDTKRAKDPKKQSQSAPKPAPAKEPSAYGAATPRGAALSEDVITNEDLERMMESLSPEERAQGVYQAQQPKSDSPEGEGAAEGDAKPAKGKETSLEETEKERAAKQQGNRSVQDTEKRVADLQTRIADLEKAVLATKNPLLPREWTKPKGGDEAEDTREQEEIAQLDNVGRLEYREEQLRQAREELAAAREELARLRGGGGNEP